MLHVVNRLGKRTGQMSVSPMPKVKWHRLGHTQNSSVTEFGYKARARPAYTAPPGPPSVST